MASGETPDGTGETPVLPFPRGRGKGARTSCPPWCNEISLGEAWVGGADKMSALLALIAGAEFRQWHPPERRTGHAILGGGDMRV